MIYTRDQETIIAQCTPKGPGALALLRISGVNAREIIYKLGSLASKKSLTDVPTHTIHFGYIYDSNHEKIDHVLFLVMDGPATFTGQDTIEITCHNNQLIIEAIIDRALACGARFAQPGEFTQRAVLNKKIDILQAEGIQDLIQAPTHAARKAALAQTEGSFSHWVTIVEHKLLQLVALCEGSFEFFDDEIAFDTEIRQQLYDLLTLIAHLKIAHNKQRYLKEGIRVALIGTVNAGKSSLMNQLIQRDRAIVTEHAGTTRDTLEAWITYNDVAFTIVDTAGIRATNNHIEQEGITRAYAEAAHADIILTVIDGSRPITNEELAMYKNIMNLYADKIILLFNKSDLTRLALITESQMHTMKNRESISISCTTRDGIQELEQLLIKRAHEMTVHNTASFLINQRHYNIILSIEKQLQTLAEKIKQKFDYELVAYDLKEVLQMLTELSGAGITKKSLDLIFSSFCIGK